LNNQTQRENELCLARNFGMGPLALQARFTRELIPIEDVLRQVEEEEEKEKNYPSSSSSAASSSSHAKSVLRRDNFRLGKIPSSQPALGPYTTIHAQQQHSSVAWLGASVPHSLIQEFLLLHRMDMDNSHHYHNHHHTTIDLTSTSDINEMSILDAGCGVGAALWYLLPPLTNRRQVQKFSYHGIALSTAEIHFAREMVQRQRMQHVNIFFEPRSYDDYLPRNTYHMVLAIESLAFSPNLTYTLTNLVSTLRPGGILVVADEFLVAAISLSTELVQSMRTIRGAPSLSTVEHVVSIMEQKLDCSLEAMQEYGIDYQFDGYHTWVPPEEVPVWGWMFHPPLPGHKRKLYQLRQQQEHLYRSFRARKVDDEQGRTSHTILFFRKEEN
jgi:SAM-dependent methyltransferase